MFHVSTDHPLAASLSEKRVVYHGINKSGSLALFNVLRSAYDAAGRAHQVSGYHNGVREGPRNLKFILDNSKFGHILFVGHKLYKLSNNPSIKYFTSVRHPLPRAVSVWSWLKRKNDNSDTPKPWPTLEEWAATSGHNQFTQIATGFGEGQNKKKKMPQEKQLKIAIEALRTEFAFVGIAERFEPTIFALATLLGLPRVPVWHRDTRQDRRALETLSDRELTAIHDGFAHDFTFYEAAKRLFEDRIVEFNFPPHFADYEDQCRGEYKDDLAKLAAA